MKLNKRFILFLLTVVSCLMLAACSKQVEVDLNNYVNFKYEGFDGSGTAELSVDYNKVITDFENDLGEKNAMSALRILRKIEVSADKTEKLSNNETITVKWGDINTNQILEESGMNLKYSDFTTTVSGLDELEKIDLFKDIEIRTGGMDTDGYAYFYSSNLPSQYWFIDFELDKSEKLSNGDKIKITATSDEGDIDKRLAELGKAALSREYIYTITGLEELKEYDPFDGISLSFKGVNGNGTARMDKDSSVNDYIWSWDYNLDKEEELSNGDVIIVTVDSGYDKSIEEAAASRGLKMTATTKEFTVEGLAEPLTDTAMLDPILFDLLKMEDIDKIKAYWAKGEERSVEPDSLKNVEYIGSIITYQEGNSWRAENNALYNIYRCDVKCSFDEQRWVYWYSLYDGITRKNDGGFDIPEPKCPSDNYTVSTFMISGEAFTTEDRTHFYLGYETYEKLRENHIRNENLVVFDNVNDEDKKAFVPAFVSAAIVDKNGIGLDENLDLSVVGCAAIYGDGTYTITLSPADFTGAPASIDGLSTFKLMVYKYEDCSVDILNAVVSDFNIVCDGNPVEVTQENISAGINAENGNVEIWLFDNDLGLTGKKAAVRSKGFGFSEKLEITFTVTGTASGEGNTDNQNPDDNTDIVDNNDNTDIIDNTDNPEDTENAGNNNNTDNPEDPESVGNDPAVSGIGQYSVILVSVGEDRTRMIKLVNDYSKIGLMAARDLVDNVENEPMVVIHTNELDYANTVKEDFESYGATVEIRTNW